MYVSLPLTESGEIIPALPLIRERVLHKDTEEIGAASARGATSLKEKDFLFESIDLLKALLRQEMSKLILVGDSGAGKTTTLKWLTFNLARISLKNLESTGEAQNIPIYLNLADFCKNEEITETGHKAQGIPAEIASLPFENFLLSSLKERKIFFDKEVAPGSRPSALEDELIPFLKTGKFVFLMDGLDLLSISTEFNPIKYIQNFINRYAKNSFLLSCRTGVYYPAFPDNYRIIKCLELSDEKIKIYLESYIKDPQKKSQIFDQIMADSQLKEISRTPLVLILMTAAFLRSKEIPHRKSEIYSSYLNCLYTVFEKRGGFGQSEKELLQDVLIELGFKMAIDNKSIISIKDMLKLIDSVMERNGYKGLDANGVLTFCKQLGFLKVQKDEIEFFYQTYKDYFAAHRLKELFLKRFDISPIYNHPRWEDTLVFLSGILDINDATNLVTAMLKTPYEWRNPLFLSARCAGSSIVTDECYHEIIKLLGEKLMDKFWFNQKESLYGLTRLLNKIENFTPDSDIKKRYEQTIETFSQRLNNEDWLRRERSAKSLSKMCEKDVVPYLKKLLDNENPFVYNAAYEAIVEIERREKEELKVVFSSTVVLPVDTTPDILPVGEKEQKIESPLVHEIKKGHKTIFNGLVVSIVRSPELLRQLDETKMAIRNQLRENVFIPAIDMGKGTIIKSIGSSIVAIFEHPNDAVYAAIKMQSGVDDFNLRQPSRRVYLKIGIHTEEIVNEKDIQRDLIKTTISIGKLAIGGQILLTAQTHKIIHGDDKTIKFRYLGSRRLKENGEKKGLYELLWQDKGQVSVVKESIMALEYLEVVSAFNTSKNKMIAGKIKVFQSFFNKLIGLMFVKKIEPILLKFQENKRINLHTFFVLAPLDIVFLDNEFNVIELMENILPFSFFNKNTWRIYQSKLPTKYVLEMPAGIIKNTNTELSDIIIFKEQV